MQNTDSHGNTVRDYLVPASIDSAVNKLANIGALVAPKEWERAAIIAAFVKPAPRGRPKRGVSNGKLNIDEFCRLSLYGLTSRTSILFYLWAWNTTGLPVPEPGKKTDLPTKPFPEVAQWATRNTPDHSDADDEEIDDIIDDEEEPEPEPTPSARKNPAPASPKRNDPITQFLKVLDRMDPAVVMAGHNKEDIKQFLNTLRSWLEDAEEVAADMD